MTAPGATPGDDGGLEQEAIWEGSEATGPAAGDRDGAARGLAQGITSTARVAGPAGLLLADVPNRIMALVIDTILLSLSGFALAWLAGGLVSEAGALDTAGGELDVVAFLVVLLLQLAISGGYFGGAWALVGATGGMRLLGLRVGSETDGRRLDPRHAALRWLVVGIPALLVSLALYVPHGIALILAGLGLVWPPQGPCGLALEFQPSIWITADGNSFYLPIALAGDVRW